MRNIGRRGLAKKTGTINERTLSDDRTVFYRKRPLALLAKIARLFYSFDGTLDQTYELLEMIVQLSEGLSSV